MLKKEVIDDALEKVLADEDLTLASALRTVSEAEHPEEQFTYQVHYGRFITTVGRIYAIDRKDQYTEMARRFVEFLRKANLLAEPVAVPAVSTATSGYTADEFDFSDWGGIRRASGF